MAVRLLSLQYVLPRAVTASSRPSAAHTVPTGPIYVTAGVCRVCMYKGKGKGHRRTGHEGPEGV